MGRHILLHLCALVAVLNLVAVSEAAHERRPFVDAIPAAVLSGSGHGQQRYDYGGYGYGRSIHADGEHKSYGGHSQEYVAYAGDPDSVTYPYGYPYYSGGYPGGAFGGGLRGSSMVTSL